MGTCRHSAGSTRLLVALLASLAAAVTTLAAPTTVATPTALLLSDGRAEFRNDFLARQIAFTPHLHTTAITNLLTGRVFEVTSDEFELTVDGLATPLRTRDFVAAGAPTTPTVARGKELRVPLRHVATGIEVEVIYRLDDDAFWIQKLLVVRAGQKMVNDLEVERLRFADAGIQRFDQKGANGGPWRLTIGRPLYVGGQLFLGLEYPAGHHLAADDGTVSLRHHPGRTGTLESKVAVIGVAPDQVNERVHDWFFRYIDRVRARPVKRFTLWDEYHNDAEWQVEDRFKVAKDCFNDRGVTIDAALMDGGWTAPKSIMRVDPERADRPAFVRKQAREKLATNLGLHVITSGPRGTVDHQWLRDNFDMIEPVSYCLADPRAHKEFHDNLVGYVKELGVAAFKYDWAHFTCLQADHRGHKPGEHYAREAMIDRFIETQDALRAANPDIFLYDTGWYSAWWMLHYDAVFSAGGSDYNPWMSGPPSTNENDLQATWRDGVIYENFQERDPQYPLTGLMNHSPITMGWGNWNAKQEYPLDRFTDMLVINYLRGTQLTEFYMNLSALSTDQRDALAGIMKWAARNDDVILADTRFQLGDPRKAEPYGYAHFARDGRGLIAVRNPGMAPQSVELTFDEAMGMRQDAGPGLLSVVYPYLWSEPRPITFGGKHPLTLGSHETVVLSVLPLSSKPQPVPVGVRYEMTTRVGDAVSYTILSNAKADGIDVTFSDGSVRPASFPPPRNRLVYRPPTVHAAPAAVRATSPDKLVLNTRIDKPEESKARLIAVQWTESAGQAQALSSGFRLDGKELTAARTINGSRGLDKVAGPGWVVTETAIDKSGDVEVTTGVTLEPGIAKWLEDLPFDPPGGAVSTNAKRLPFELWLLAEEPLRPSSPIRVDTAGGRPLPVGLPAFWQRRERTTRSIATVEEGVSGLVAHSTLYKTGLGAMPYTDRAYTVTVLHPDLDGLASLRFSHDHAKQDATLRFQARRKVKVYVVFGPVNPNDQWLDPQPGWTLAYPRGLALNNPPDIGGDIYAKEFPAGNLELFAGHKGNYVLVAIAPK